MGHNRSEDMVQIESELTHCRIVSFVFDYCWPTGTQVECTGFLNLNATCHKHVLGFG